MKDLTNNVRHIANQLENPEPYCAECDCCWSDINDGDDCPDCGSETYPIGGLDYISDALDIEYTVSSAGEYLGARILVAFGGPNIWIDTRHNRVDGHWWQDSYNCAYTDAMGLDDACRELWECK